MFKTNATKISGKSLIIIFILACKIRMYFEKHPDSGLANGCEKTG